MKTLSGMQKKLLLQHFCLLSPLLFIETKTLITGTEPNPDVQTSVVQFFLLRVNKTVVDQFGLFCSDKTWR